VPADQQQPGALLHPCYVKVLHPPSLAHAPRVARRSKVSSPPRETLRFTTSRDAIAYTVFSRKLTERIPPGSFASPQSRSVNRGGERRYPSRTTPGADLGLDLFQYFTVLDGSLNGTEDCFSISDPLEI
jgi:hypothetical protein